MISVISLKGGAGVALLDQPSSVAVDDGSGSVEPAVDDDESPVDLNAPIRPIPDNPLGQKEHADEDAEDRGTACEELVLPDDALDPRVGVGAGSHFALC
jgi:hypothetical protein